MFHCWTISHRFSFSFELLISKGNGNLQISLIIVPLVSTFFSIGFKLSQVVQLKRILSQFRWEGRELRHCDFIVYLIETLLIF